MHRPASSSRAGPPDPVVERARTSLVPPRLASIPKEEDALEYSSRSLVYALDGRRLLRAWGSPARPWVLAVEPDGGRWRVDAWGAGPRAAREAARTWFSLADPLEEFYRATRNEPVLRGTDRSFRGLRLPRDANLYESLLHAIVGQQLSVAAANAIRQRLLARLGRPLRADGLEVPCVPSPARVARAGPSGLRSLGMSAAKSRALVAVAGRAMDGRPAADALRRIPLPAARESLEALPGVGRWTAENVLLRGAGRRDVFVGGDLAVRVALDRFRAVPRSAPEAAARAWADARYPGWGSYATLYLWRKLVSDRFADRTG